MENEADDLSCSSMTLAAPKDAAYYDGLPTTILDLKLLTDRWGLKALLHRAAEEPESMDQLEDYYPGLRRSIVLGMREIAAQKVKAATVVFLNGCVQVWPDPERAHLPPSERYYTGITANTPGYEAVIESELAAYRKEAAAAMEREQAEMREALKQQLEANPREALHLVRVTALGMEQRDATDNEIVAAIQAVLYPWATSSKERAELTVQILGKTDNKSVLWILGTPFAAWRLVNDIAPLD